MNLNEYMMNDDENLSYQLPQIQIPLTQMPQTEMQQIPQMPQRQVPTQVEPMQASDLEAQFPELYYKLKPYIMMVCDQMERRGLSEPSQDMVDELADKIYEDVITLYPDVADYARNNEPMTSEEAVPAVVVTDYSRSFGNRNRRGRYWRPFRRRGVVKDLITILLLSELGSRRNRYYY